MQGFFGKPVDNLFAEPLIARWVKLNVLGWREAVVVSKNAGGTKRVTSLADTLKLNFGIVTTDRMRPNTNSSMLESSLFYESLANAQMQRNRDGEEYDVLSEKTDSAKRDTPQRPSSQPDGVVKPTTPQRPRNISLASNPLVQTIGAQPGSSPTAMHSLPRVSTAPVHRDMLDENMDEYTDERAREVITGRLVHGHIVDDDHPSPALSALSASISALPGDRQSQDLDNPAFDPMTSSFMSTVSSNHPDHALGGTFDAAASSDEEEEGLKDPELEHTITLVGNVRDKTVLLMDDMIDKAATWVAAAETVVKRGGAKKVYCIGTHGLFGEDSLEEMAECECIDYIVVTNSFPIPNERVGLSKKLVVIDVSHLLSEAIRRNHHGGKCSYFEFVRYELMSIREHLCAVSGNGLSQENTPTCRAYSAQPVWLITEVAWL